MFKFFAISGFVFCLIGLAIIFKMNYDDMKEAIAESEEFFEEN